MNNSHNIKKSAYGAITFTLLVSAFAFATPIELKFPSERLNHDARTAAPYIVQVLAEHEREFPGAIRYRDLFFYTPLNRLAHVQREALADLRANSPDFVSKWSEKKDLAEIEVTVTADKVVSQAAKKLSSFEWYWLKRSWTKEFNSGHKGQDQTVPAQADLERLIQSVNRTLDAVSPQLYHWEFNEVDRALVTLILAGSLLKTDPHMTHQELETRIEQAEVGILDYLKDPLAFAPLLARLKDPERARTRIEAAHRSIIDRLYSETAAIELTKGQFLKLREVHPNIAIFRGYVGNDCSTSFSPGFVFTPYDRYFYVFDATGLALGYVGLTMVHVGGRPAAFIHTIQGPDITASQAELILRAMTQSAPQVLGTGQVLLGPDESIRSNVNFLQIEETMERAVEGKTAVPMQFHDMLIRKIIEKWESTLEYDNPERNHSGRKLEFGETDLLKIRITARPFDASFARLESNTDACEHLITGR